ncbi:MAG: FHA domain-containing protein [Pseudomonadales bacterium]|nr:FHA domain-containing protein [Pseudomonadales bacterium]
MSTDVGNQTLFNVESIPLVQEIVLSYNGQEYHIRPENTPFTIGRDEKNHLAVNSKFASRVHCKILFHEKNYLLKDCSTNGTYIRLGVSHPIIVNNSISALTGNGGIKLGQAIKVGDKDMINFKAIY